MDTTLTSPQSVGSHSPEKPRRRQRILSPVVESPLCLLFVCILPQLFLLLMNIRSLGTIWSEMSERQRQTGRWLLGSEVAMIAGVAALVIVLRRLRKPVNWAMNWPLLGVAVAYLWFALYATGSMIPSSVSLWILPPETFAYYQFAFVMPMAFLAAMRLACFDTKQPLSTDIAVSIASLVAIPLGFYVVVEPLSRVRALEKMIGVLFVAGTIAGIGILLRLTIMSYVGMRRKGPLALGILTGLVALAAPIGGLVLNRQIPFPADFQSTGVYVMAALNGLVLLLPNFRSLRLHRAVWLAQCALFPFTFYFSIVFLPFLPLSLIAMVVVGAGFLILTPTALFVLHGQRIIDGFRNEVRDGGKLVPAVLGVIAISAIPVGYTVQALVDQRVLSRAIDHAYSADYCASEFKGSTAAIGRALTGLRDFKEGIQLPFLSDYYSWLVFDGLVLPDEKMAHLHRVFLGRDMPESSRRAGESFFGNGMVGRGNRRSFMEGRGVAAPFPKDVVIEKLEPLTEAEDGATQRTRVTLTLRNTIGSVSEFAANLHVPEGVLVSGFWLRVGNDLVPGRIFEKKTALWVYQKIRDVTRRDPGILMYTGPETLELRVFPFGNYETRTVEIEFLRPTGASAPVQIGDQTVLLSEPDAPASIAVAPAGEGGATVTIQPHALAALPSVTRKPYLHFIVDRSVSSTLEGAALRTKLVQLAAHFPAAKECRITAANFDALELTDGFLPTDTLAQWDARRIERLPKRGGFVQDRAVKRALLLAADDLRTASPAALERFPVPIVLRSGNSTAINEGDLQAFERLAPDLPGYFVVVDGGELAAYDGDNKPSTLTTSQPPQPVVLLKLGAAIAPVSAAPDASTLCALPGGAGDLQVWYPERREWKPMPHAEVPIDSRYARGAGAWLTQTALVYCPALGKEALRKLVAISRETGVIVPATSYIVVENDAQWRKLADTEKKKLANNAALELQETPEPTAALLLLCGGAALATRRWRRA